MNTEEPLNSGTLESKGIDRVLVNTCDVCGKSRCSRKIKHDKCAKIRQQRGFAK